MALSRGAPPRPQMLAAQADAQPFAALLDAAASPAPDRGADAPAASAHQPNQPKPAADTGAAAQDGAPVAAAAGSRSAGSASSGSAASDNGAPAQSAHADAMQGAAASPDAGDGKTVAAPDANGLANSGLAFNANGTLLQSTHANAMSGAAAKSAGDRKPSPAPNANGNTTLIAVPLPSGNDNLNTGGDTGVSSTSNTPAPANSESTDNRRGDESSTPAVALVVAAALNAGDAASANAPRPAAKPEADGKDGQDDKSGDAAAASPPVGGVQPPSADNTQPVAAAVMVNAASDPAPAGAAKPALTITDVVKGRARAMPTPAASNQAAPAQAGNADAPNSSSAVDADASNASPSGSNATMTDDGATAAFNAQQAADQQQTPGANGVALLSPIDFASIGTEHFGLRGETASSLNGAAGSAAPSGAANATLAPNFGIFAPNAIAANAAAPAAAASNPAVPVAGLAVAIAARAQAGSSQFDIRLDPPELGRIDVRLDVDGSGQVRTHVTADRADTLQLLQSQQPQLERALEQAGLKTADNGLQFTLRDQSFAGQNGGTGGEQHYANQPAAPLVIPEIDAAPIDTAQIYARLRLGNGLDISV